MTEQETQGAVSDETSTADSNVPAEDVFVQDRTLMQYFFITLRGALMGWADVIPGVSGGTMALILGIYHELVASIRSLDFTAIRLLLKRDFKGFAKHTNIVFLVFLGAGIGSAIVVMARIMPKLMKAYPAQMKGLFFGLVLASIFLVLRRIDRHTPMSSLMFLFGTLFAYFVVGLLPGSTPNEPWFLFLVGCIAICAMILPGISGAFLLLVFGKYAYVLNALSSTIKGFLGMLKTQNPQLFFNENLLIVAVFGAGCIVGILSFSRLLNWLLKRFHLMTMAVLAGLMLGSLRRLWPFQHEVTKIIRNKPRVIEFSNQWPAKWGGTEFMAIALLVVGFVAVFVLDRMTSDDGGSSSDSNDSGSSGSNNSGSNETSAEEAAETSSETTSVAEKKKHSDLLMVWLGILAIANALLAVVCIFGGNFVQQLLPYAPRWGRHALAFLALLNISSVVTLFEWKRLGFWSYSLSSFAMFFILAWFNPGMGTALVAPVGVVLLYVMLNLGRDKGSWAHLS